MEMRGKPIGGRLKRQRHPATRVVSDCVNLKTCGHWMQRLLPSHLNLPMLHPIGFHPKPVDRHGLARLCPSSWLSPAPGLTSPCHRAGFRHQIRFECPPLANSEPPSNTPWHRFPWSKIEWEYPPRQSQERTAMLRTIPTAFSFRAFRVT